MNEVKAQATTGYWLVLDQCPGCGGIWCDRWELYPLTAAEAERLDDADPTAVSRPVTPVGAALHCPRCRARLVALHDPALPSDAHVERCLNCGGLWLNRGDLRRIKTRGGRPTASVSSVNAAAADRLAQALAAESWPTVRNLDSAMTNTAADDTDDETAAEIAKGAGWLLLRALLRLLLHV